MRGIRSRASKTPDSTPAAAFPTPRGGMKVRGGPQYRPVAPPRRVRRKVNTPRLIPCTTSDRGPPHSCHIISREPLHYDSTVAQSLLVDTLTLIQSRRYGRLRRSSGERDESCSGGPG